MPRTRPSGCYNGEKMVKGGAIMKKLTRRSFTAAGILAVLGVGGVFTATSNLIGCVYGPPPEEYEPEDNEIEAVYGPPEDLGWDEPVEGPETDPETDSEDDPETDPEDDPDYDPSLNELVDVYGPPADVYDDGEDG